MQITHCGLLSCYAVESLVVPKHLTGICCLCFEGWVANGNAVPSEISGQGAQEDWLIRTIRMQVMISPLWATRCKEQEGAFSRVDRAGNCYKKKKNTYSRKVRAVLSMSCSLERTVFHCSKLWATDYHDIFLIHILRMEFITSVTVLFMHLGLMLMLLVSFNMMWQHTLVLHSAMTTSCR
jgi:hypothetical protein